MQSLITKQMGIINYYQSFSRDQEREADIYAIETLNKLKLSKVPLIHFLNFLEKKSIQKGISNDYFKFSSHPIYSERYKIINQSSKKQKTIYDKNINNQFYYIKSKLFGFTSDELLGINEYLDANYLEYTKSIILSKKGNLHQSMKILNKIIKKNPNNKFLLETKADILYSHGYSYEALKFYEKVIKIYSNNHYVNKRIFDIKFTSHNIKNINFSNNLFNDFSFLIIIFNNDKELKSKFKQIAEQNNKLNWIKYFEIENMINNNDLINDFEKIMTKLLKETEDSVLKNLIKKQINRIKNV